MIAAAIPGRDDNDMIICADDVEREGWGWQIICRSPELYGIDSELLFCEHESTQCLSSHESRVTRNDHVYGSLLDEIL